MTGPFRDPRVFDVATAVERIAPAGAEHRFEAEIHDGWDIAGNANGGYVLAIAGRAMAQAMGRPPLSVTAHYLAPAPPGPCEVVVTTVRDGRRLATCTAALVQGGTELIRVLGTFGVPSDRGMHRLDGGPPELPPYDECIGLADVDDLDLPDLPGLMRRLAVRLRPSDAGFRSGNASGRAEIAGWFAFATETPIDTIGLLLVADAFPPAVFNTGVPFGWVPTVELTVHIRATPAPGPLRCLFRTRYVAGGLLDEEGEVWDATGTLVAQSRQLALEPRT
ncbi:MAG: thioesterase family protein [Ilumatobacteraceae bacterium]